MDDNATGIGWDLAYYAPYNKIPLQSQVMESFKKGRYRRPGSL